MLNSMGEAELKMLASHFSDSRLSTIGASIPVSTATAPPTSFGPAQQTRAAAATLLDVDDISAGDLLSADLVNMSGILRDLAGSSPSKSLRPIGSEAGAEGSASGAAADLSELFAAEFVPIGARLSGDGRIGGFSNDVKSDGAASELLDGRFSAGEISERCFGRGQNLNGEIDQEGMSCAYRRVDLTRGEQEQEQDRDVRGEAIQTPSVNGHVATGQNGHGQTARDRFGRDGRAVRRPFGRGQVRRGRPVRGRPVQADGHFRPAVTEKNPGENSVPELTTVNMFWNDLPGLVLGGREHVRLVDIHKQIMPAKDTGILKKRCLMMGLEVSNCSELQRDFLVRYMGAAKSKSTVVIERNDAMDLIGKWTFGLRGASVISDPPF